MPANISSVPRIRVVETETTRRGLPRQVSCDPRNLSRLWKRRSASCVAFTSRQWRDAPFKAVVASLDKGSVGILAKDPRELASRLVSLSFQGMPASIISDPAIQGCHEAWLLGCQGQHHFSTQFRCPYPTKQGSQWGDQAQEGVVVVCDADCSGRHGSGGRGDPSQCNAAITLPALLPDGDIPTSLSCLQDEVGWSRVEWSGLNNPG